MERKVFQVGDVVETTVLMPCLTSFSSEEIVKGKIIGICAGFAEIEVFHTSPSIFNGFNFLTKQWVDVETIIRPVERLVKA